MKKYEAILFDLDGTLLNTIGDLTEAVNHAQRAFGYPTHTVEEVTAMVGNGIRKLLERATPEGENNPNFDDVLHSFVEYYIAHVAVKTDYYPGIPELVEQLQQRGVKMAIVSNKFQAGCEELRERFFERTIQTVLGDGEGRRRKPSTDAPFQAMRELDTKPYKTLYVGDSDVDAQTAENAGMDYVLVSWGFSSREDLEKWSPLEIAESPEDILKYFS